MFSDDERLGFKVHEVRHSYWNLSEKGLEWMLGHGRDFLQDLVPDEYNRTGASFTNIRTTLFPWYEVVYCLAKKHNSAKARAYQDDRCEDLTLRFLTEMYLDQKGRCSVTGQIMSPVMGDYEDKNPYVISIDRIDSKEGYEENNVRLCCHWANNSKNVWSNSMLEEFIQSSSVILAEKNLMSKTVESNFQKFSNYHECH